MAVLSGDSYLQEVLSDPRRDIHNEVATRFYGSSFTKDQRVRAKAVVFGLSYGREAFSLAQEYRMPVMEAQKYLDDFFALIPGVVKWKDEVRKQALHGEGDLVSLFGRHRRFWLITRDNQKDVVKEAYAFHPQADASDLNLAALCHLRTVLGNRAAARIPVHDSLLFECRAEDAQEVAEAVREGMETTAVRELTHRGIEDLKVPFPADVHIGSSWGDLG